MGAVRRPNKTLLLKLPALRGGGDVFRSRVHEARADLNDPVYLQEKESSAMPPPANPPAPKSVGARKAASADDEPVELSFEDRLREFWEKNSSAVTGVFLVILLAVLAKGGWQYFSAQQERQVEQAYAAAATTEQLKGFIAANPRHSLAAVAELRIADEAYQAGKFADAITYYDQAASSFKTGPLASRARLGLAIAKLEGGHTAEGDAALKAFAADPAEVKAFRAEAMFHLAGVAAEANNAADVKKYSGDLMALDPTSVWTQRALQLRAATKP